MDPRNGEIVFNCPAVTTVDEIQSFIDTCHNIRGLNTAEEHLAFVANNAWAPTESVIATLLQLPIWEFGYGLPGVKLNKRVSLPGHTQMPQFATSRVPDIVIDGSPIGINYDGSDHMDLESISTAAKNAAINSTDPNAQRVLLNALKTVRDKIVDDKRRDRELGSKGLFVMPVTKEDLYELGRFEQLVHLLLDGIESRTNQDMSRQRAHLSSHKLQTKRQQLAWSLLPGRRGVSIALTLQEKNMRRMRA